MHSYNKSTRMEKKRTRAQDAAKGLMIIAVVFFHCYLTTFDNTIDGLGSFNPLFAIFPFLLSSFFFYTGYNYVPNGKSFKENILRRAKQLLIPIVMCYVITIVSVSIMELIYNHNDIPGTFQAIWNSILYSLMSEPLSQMIGFPRSGGMIWGIHLGLGLLWFLYCLFICSIFFYLLVNFTNKRVENLISIVLLLLVGSFCLGEFVGIYLPYSVQCYPVVLAIMLTAAYLRKSHFLNRRILSKRDSWHHAINMIIAEAIVVGICLVAHYRIGALYTGTLPGGGFDPTLRGFDAFVGFIFSIVGTYFIHTLCRLIKHIPVVGRVLQWVGNHSAIFYLFHPIFLSLAWIAIFQKKTIWGQAQAFVYVAIVVAMLSIVCLLIDLIVKKKKINSEIVEEIENSKDPEDNI